MKYLGFGLKIDLSLVEKHKKIYPKVKIENFSFFLFLNFLLIQSSLYKNNSKKQLSLIILSAIL